MTKKKILLVIFMLIYPFNLVKAGGVYFGGSWAIAEEKLSLIAKNGIGLRLKGVFSEEWSRKKWFVTFDVTDFYALNSNNNQNLILFSPKLGFSIEFLEIANFFSFAPFIAGGVSWYSISLDSGEKYRSYVGCYSYGVILSIKDVNIGTEWITLKSQQDSNKYMRILLDVKL